jgi:hypothetical protein
MNKHQQAASDSMTGQIAEQCPDATPDVESRRLRGSIIRRQELRERDINMMYHLMDLFYANMTKENFIRDLSKKDYVIVLRDEKEQIQGFSTQQIMHIPMGEKVLHGVFSGDTIIHKEYWGNMDLFTVFANFFFQFEEQYQEFYWFLICKGYKTYRMLPTFFTEFYPNYKMETPKEMKKKMDAFGEYYSAGEYDKVTGVLCYQGIKDTLKEDVAAISKERLRDKNIAFFVEKNPDYQKGNDIVCITKLSKDNLNKRIRQFLLGDE